MTNTFSPAELQELEADIDSLNAELSEFGIEAFDADEMEEFSELDAELSDSDLEIQSLGGEDFSQMFTDEIEQQFIGRFLRARVRRWISKLVRLVRRARGCAKCVRIVLEIIRLYKSGRYGAALVRIPRAIACIRRCLRNRR